MKIKSISSAQFAGVRGMRAELSDGLNVIYGKNESGKSTLVSLLARTLFQRAKLDKRRDRVFYELYFPASLRTGAASGDYIEGSVTLHTEAGDYTVTREWGAEPRSRLDTPNGSLRDENAIAAALREVLGFGEGVYTEFLFASEQDAAASVRALLDAAKQTPGKQELTEAVTRAFSESGSASVDAMGRQIRARVAQLEGAHWDEERQAPVRSAKRWSRETGQILDAYYALEDARDELEELSRLEDEASQRARAYASAAERAEQTRRQYEDFRRFAERLSLQNERRERASAMESELGKLREAARDWPELRKNLTRAGELRRELAGRGTLDRWAAASAQADALAVLERDLEAMPCPSEEEVGSVRCALREQAVAENLLRGMDITAKLRVREGYASEIRSLRTGENVDAEGGVVRLNEAVCIEIPGVAELTLSPADTDAESVEARIAMCRKTAEEILSRYGAADDGQLEQMRRACDERRRELETANVKLALLLGGEDAAELRAAAEACPADTRAGEEIEADIRRLCGGETLERYIAASEAIAAKNESEYGSPEELSARIAQTEERFSALCDLLAEGEDIPEAYREIKAPHAYLRDLQIAAEEAGQEAERALAGKSEAAGALLHRRESLAEDPAERVELAERRLEAVKELLAHWKHIEEVFLRRRQMLTGEPMRTLGESFARYLAALSANGLSTELASRDRPDIRIYSMDRDMDYELLSEGTKETVALAFRLAVLDQLFPDGGVLVLDDPLVNMDDERAERACALLREVSERHQVVFLTCRDEYPAKLGGKQIRL